MKQTVLCLLTAFLCFLIGVGASQLRRTPQPQVMVTAVQSGDGTILIFEGTVVHIAPPVPGSGVVMWYRLAKYRVDRVVYGRYPHSEIVVHHLSMTGEELNNINVGDRVCVVAEEKEKNLAFAYTGASREPGKKVDIFYIGNDVDPNSPACR